MLRLVRPHGPLAHVAQALWLYGGEPPAHATDLLLPTGEVEIVVSLRDGRAVAVGPRTRAFPLGTAEQRDTLGVVLRAGRAAALLGAPVAEVRDRVVPLAELWRGTDIGERAAGAASPRAQLAAVHDALAGRIAATPHPAAVAAVARLAAAPERIRIAGLEAELGLSSRRLQQVFRADVGMSPKAYQRLQRFRRALRRIDDARTVGWAAFALDRGYCDQAHFVEEFGAHAGLTPSQYVARRGQFLNHVPA